MIVHEGRVVDTDDLVTIVLTDEQIARALPSARVELAQIVSRLSRSCDRVIQVAHEAALRYEQPTICETRAHGDRLALPKARRSCGRARRPGGRRSAARSAGGGSSGDPEPGEARLAVVGALR